MIRRRKRARTHWAILAVCAATSCAACESVVGAEPGIRAALAKMGSGFSVDVPGEPPLLVTRAEFREAQVFEANSGYALNALVDAEGQTGGAHLSYLGIETIPFVRVGTAWRPRPPVLPALQALLAALRARERASATRDLATFRDRLVSSVYKDGPVDRNTCLARLAVRFQTARSWTNPTTWTIRVDRGEAQVLEEATVASLGSGAVPRRLRFKLVLEGGLWRFTSGLD